VLVQVNADSITAGIPLLAPPRLPGRDQRLVSLPFTDSLSPLVDLGAAREFSGAAESLLHELGVARIEIRGPLDGARDAPETAVIHLLELDRDPEQIERGFTQMKRRNVRIAERRGLTVDRAESKRDVTETFYELHLQTRRRLGVPVQPKRFFRLLWRDILEPGGGFALIVRRGRRAIAGGIFLVGRDRTIYKFGASEVAYQADRPNDLLMASAIREACVSGSKVFDFGRSDLVATGLRAFKSGWGASEQPLIYATIGAGESTRSPGPEKALGRILRRTPTSITRAVGELFYRYAA
jgi:CelD/BcsL family acetyltransferase involved in cellulose biosynthesis